MGWKEKLWPEWNIEEEIGAGSYGKVYKIKRQDIGGTYFAALKVISVPKDEDEVLSLRSAEMDDEQIRDYYQRFAKKLSAEFAVMERLKGNTNIVSYEDHKIIPRENGFGFDVLIRMELLTPLNKHLNASTVGEHELLKLGIDMCSALSVCEREQIIHRDIKPGNVFVSARGDYKLGDFSIAQTADLNRTEGSPQGTYSYMAPEIFMGKPYDSTIDLYALGLILYRMLNSGRAPFLPLPPEPLTPALIEQANEQRLKGKQLPPPAYASEKMSEVILKACAFDRADRYQTAEQLQDALRACKGNMTAQPKKKEEEEPVEEVFVDDELTSTGSDKPSGIRKAVKADPVKEPTAKEPEKIPERIPETERRGMTGGGTTPPKPSNPFFQPAGEL